VCGGVHVCGHADAHV